MLDAHLMLSAARDTFKRLGFISMFLLTLAVIMPAAQARACEPVGSIAGSAVLVDAADDCEVGDCETCGLACAHGCCQMPPPGVLRTADRAFVMVRDHPVSGWTNALGAPLGAGHGLERPPRV